MQIRNRKSQSCSQFAVYPTVGWRFSSFLESLPEMKEKCLLAQKSQVLTSSCCLAGGRRTTAAAAPLSVSFHRRLHHSATLPPCQIATLPPCHTRTSLTNNQNHLHCNLHCSSNIIISSHQPSLHCCHD